MEATPRAASHALTNREHPVVTRHGLRSSHAETPPFRSLPPCMLLAKTSEKRWHLDRSQIPIKGLNGENSHSPAPATRIGAPVLPS